MILSSMFHTFLCHSERVKYKWKEADHSGILIALWGTYTRLVVPVDTLGYQHFGALIPG